MKKGFFITFEGGEGSGKSTQIKRAAAYLKKRGRKVVILREPGGTKVSEAIRKVILDKHLGNMTSETELLLYLAARAQIVREKIVPALEQKKVVICDRYEDSTMAYQGFGRKLPLSVIEQMSEFVRGDILPDFTVLLDVNPVHGMRRGGRVDRMERQSLKFHEKVRLGFLALAKKEPHRYLVIDATLTKDEVASKIREKLDHVLG